ncbi:MAG: FadR/GntR family transcriptional regulator [Bergeyella sp.]
MKIEILTKNESEDAEKIIISKIRDFINRKNLEPGDKLPSERSLSEMLGVSRNNVRDAIQKLELYGLLKSVPQSGTFVANIGVTALNGMISDILTLEEPDFKSLVETRILLELKTVRLAALRRTEEDLIQIGNALEDYTNKVLAGEDAVQEDLLFHLAIAKACGNSTMNNFMLIITPDIIINFEKYHVCDKDQPTIGIKEHEAIFEAIRKQDPTEAKQKMKDHFKELYKYCYNAYL